MSKLAKIVSVGCTVAVVCIAAYWYLSPYLAVKQLHAAAQSKDADAFNDHVDYASLRESFKGQFSAMLTDKLGQTDDTKTGFAAMGAALGMLMANQMIDAMVRPETMMRVMQEGKMAPKVDGAPPSEAARQEKPEWQFERKSMDKLIAYPKKAGAASGEGEKQVGFVFQRSGFANWKLTEVRLPNL